jgi:hypothetical protein
MPETIPPQNSSVEWKQDYLQTAMKVVSTAADHFVFQ